MPRIEPFQGLRYNPVRFNDLADVIAPPYDVISDEMRQALYDRHPQNFVRLEYGTDASGEDRYAVAAKLLREWMSSGALIVDDRPAYYVYEQTFALPEGVDSPNAKAEYRRRALFAAVELGEWGNGIYPHERTLAAPKKDRMQLLATTKANLSPVFGIAQDASRAFDDALASIINTRQPTCDTTDQGIGHRLWVVDDAAGVASIRASVADTSITIADGHHRYETALAYRNELGASGNDPANWVMMTLVSGSSDDLVILPIHRVVAGVDAATLADLPETLAAHFEIERHPFSHDATAAVLKEIQSGDRTRFGIYTGGDTFFTATLRDGATIQGIDNPAVAALGIVQLHQLVLKGALRVDTDDPETQKRVSYTVRVDEAARKVQSGEASVAAFVRPTGIAETERVARSGATMPQKSTYFYPKMPSGLVARRID